MLRRRCRRTEPGVERERNPRKIDNNESRSEGAAGGSRLGSRLKIQENGLFYWACFTVNAPGLIFEMPSRLTTIFSPKSAAVAALGIAILVNGRTCGGTAIISLPSRRVPGF